MFAVTELEQPLWADNPAHVSVPRSQAFAAGHYSRTRGIRCHGDDPRSPHARDAAYIVGDRMTIADCVTAYLIDWANEQRLIDTFPQLRAYLARMYARPKAPHGSPRPSPASGRDITVPGGDSDRHAKTTNADRNAFAPKRYRMQNRLEHELLQLDDFCPDARRGFPTIGPGRSSK